ncbi:MAG: Ger(x)C family spore germination protein [Clostridia bacterium]|nr:Ger(x)C family spore germination protein [Clostridia bacterium]
MKKIKLIIPLILLLTLTACMPQNTEIKYRLVISGIGLDFDKEKGQYELTVQVLETSKSSSEQGKSETPVANYTVKGKTVAQAIRSLGENTGKYPLYSQNRMIILGSSLTDGQMIKALNFFVREYTSRPDVFIAAATGKASDVLTIDAGGEVPAKLIESAIEQSNENSVCVDTELYNTVNLSLEKTTCFTLPLIEVVEDRIPKQKTIKVTGTRACSKDVEPKMMSDTETMAYLFTMNKINTGSFSITSEDVSAALEIISSKTKTTLELKNGKPVFNIDVKCEVDVVEFDSETFTAFSENDVHKIEKAAEQYIKSGMNGLIERFTKKEHCDIFRFGKRLQQKYPDVYEEMSKDWKKSLSETEVNVTVSVKIGRIGEMTMKADKK